MEIINKTQFEEVTKEGVVLVDFFATWCGPCKMLGPVLEGLSKEMTEAKFYKVDVDQESELAAKYGIMSIPTLLLFKDGQVVNRVAGFQAKAEIEKFVRSAL